MLTRRTLAVFTAALLGAASAVHAQGAYVSASLLGDIVRSSHTAGVDRTGSGSGEALGFALRAGTPLGAAWGVELEFAYPGEIEGSISTGQLTILQSTVTVPGTVTIPPILPIPLEIEASARHTTLAASLWYQQQLTGRVALAYLGGISFSRTSRELEVDYGGVPRVGVPFALDSESIEYGVRPMAGFEARISLTEHVQIVPGLRLHASTGTWLIRPSAGLGWTF